MRALVLALVLTASAASAQAPREVFDTNPDWLKKPSSDDLIAAWPFQAYRRGLGGRVVLLCSVTPAGALEGCKVMSETPQGEGFGAAGLMLVPSFVMRPAIRDGKAVASTVRVPITFEGGRPGSGDEKMIMVNEPSWARAPSFADMAAAWPTGAAVDVAHVSMRCRVTLEGYLQGCETLTETPRGKGFAKAAREQLVPKFQMRVTADDARTLKGAQVNVPVHFTNPRTPPARTVTRPRWITSIDPQRVVAIYPDAALNAGVRSGKGVADCAVAADGMLVDCKPAPATPTGLGFSEAAVRIASLMRMNPWTDGGMPVDGVRLRLPVTFNLAPEEPAAK